MKLVIAALLGLLNGSLYAAQTSDEYKACSNGASTQTALHRCADEELRRADRELNDAYQRLLSVVKDEPRAVEKVKAMERAWLLYRDAYVEATYPAADKQAAYGTMFVVEVLLIRVRLTRQQAAALGEVMAHHRAARR